MSEMLNASRVRNFASRHATYSSLVTRTSVFYLVICLSLLARLNGLSYIGESLWYEDGYIYINDSYEFGLKSLWLPWAGYEHLYNRIVGVIARQAPLEASPYIFWTGWVCSFLLAVWQLQTRAKRVGLNKLSLLLLATTISLQPNHGESFFNLDHADYWLGVALALYVCIPVQRPATVLEIVFVSVASLTGVASIALVPVLAAQFLTLKDFSVRKIVYIVVLLSAAIQVTCLLLSDRGKGVGIDTHIAHWVGAIAAFLTFGSKSDIVYCAAAAFWVIAAIYFCKRIRVSRGEGALFLAPQYAAIAVVFWFLLVVLRGEDSLSSMNPQDMDSRYFVLPYSLIFFIAFVCTKDDMRSHAALVAALGFVCGLTFLTVSRPDREGSKGGLAHKDMEWRAFARFQRVKPDLIIPINAPLPIYPPLPSVQINKHSTASVNDGMENRPILLSAPMHDLVEMDPSRQSISSRVEGGSPVITFDVGKYCLGREYLALEIDIWRERMGGARVSWGRPNDEKSLERYYPAGAVTMQFAFEKPASGQEVRLFPALGVRDSPTVRSMQEFGKSTWGSGFVVAEPTSPGGKVNLKEVRLFCLE